MKRLGLFILMGILCLSVWGQETIGVRVYFRQGYSLLEPNFANNQEKLDEFIQKVKTVQQDSSYILRSLCIEGAASPEGKHQMNLRLANKRASRIIEYLRNYLVLDDSICQFKSRGVDWEGLTRLVEASEMPYRDKVLDILANTPVWVIRNGQIVDSRKRQLQMLAGGKAWWYMYEHFFPELRNSGVHVICEIDRIIPDTIVVEEPEAIEIIKEEPQPCDTVVAQDTIVIPDTIYTPTPSRRSFYMGIKSNMLYDLALVPNIGVEFHLAKGWTIGASWMYAWWNSRNNHNFWRTYGGELVVRKYFGKLAKEKPLQGHHLGVYGQALTYDFELGGRGYIGGKPGGTLFENANYAAGIEYGYSLPIARRFNIDFAIGFGYMGGEYWEYKPIDEHYVWQSTKQRHWIGPTKAEISLVWLIGSDNYNKKGGKQ